MLYSATNEYKNMVLGTERIEKFLLNLNIDFKRIKYIFRNIILRFSKLIIYPFNVPFRNCEIVKIPSQVKIKIRLVAGCIFQKRERF